MGEETWGETARDEERARSCVHACTLLMSVCIGYERVVVSGEGDRG